MHSRYARRKRVSAIAAAWCRAPTVACSCSASAFIWSAFCAAAACSSAICCCTSCAWLAASALLRVNTGAATVMMVPTCGRTAFSAGRNQAAIGRSVADWRACASKNLPLQDDSQCRRDAEDEQEDRQLFGYRVAGLGHAHPHVCRRDRAPQGDEGGGGEQRGAGMVGGEQLAEKERCREQQQAGEKEK